MDKSKFNIKKEWRRFGIVLAILLLLLGTRQLLKGNSSYSYFFFVSLFTLISALSFPVVLKPLFILFSYLGIGIGWFMTRMVLSLLFFVIFTLMGVSMRLFGKLFLDIQYPQHAQTFWLTREQKKIHYKDQF